MTRPVPRTTSVRATGTCGHTFTDRFPLHYGLAGQPPTAERVEEVARAKEDRVSRLAEAPCPECFAATLLEGMRGAVERLAIILDRPAPPRMDCSARMAAFAEGVRSDLIWRETTTRALAVRDALRYPSAGEQMTVAALRQAWPEIDSESETAVPPDIDRLAQELRAITGSGLGSGNLRWLTGGGLSATDWLAVWLVLRAEWARTWPILGDARPRAWIAARRRLASSGGVHQPAHSVLSAACLVARIGGWEDRSDAVAAFEVLASSGDALAAALEHGTGTLQERILSAAVIRALSEPAPDPFDL